MVDRATKVATHWENKERTWGAGTALRMRQLVIRSLGDLEGSSKLVAYCPACRRSQFLDLEAMRSRYGAELSLRSLRARLRCSRCGARRPEVIHVWDNGAAYAGN